MLPIDTDPAILGLHWNSEILTNQTTANEIVGYIRAI